MCGLLHRCSAKTDIDGVPELSLQYGPISHRRVGVNSEIVKILEKINGKRREREREKGIKDETRTEQNQEEKKHYYDLWECHIHGISTSITIYRKEMTNCN